MRRQLPDDFPTCAVSLVWSSRLTLQPLQVFRPLLQVFRLDHASEHLRAFADCTNDFGRLGSGLRAKTTSING